MKHLSGIDSGRLIGVLLIVLLHAGTAFEYVGGGLEKRIWELLCYHVAPMALPAFFFLSGWLTFRSGASYRDQLLRRLKHLVIPYFAWNVFCILLFLGAAQVVPRIGMRVAQFELNSFGGIVTKLFDLNCFPMVQPLWYLRALFLLFLCAPLFKWCYRRQWMSALVLIGAMFLGYSIATLPAYAVGCFFLGGWCATRHLSFETLYPWRWGFLLLTVITITANGLFSTCSYVGYALMLLSAPTLWVFAQRWMCSLPHLSHYSFFIYAGHFLFASTLLHLLGPRLPNLPGMLTLLCCTFVLLGTTLCLLAWHIGRWICPRLLRAFDGSL